MYILLFVLYTEQVCQPLNNPKDGKVYIINEKLALVVCNDGFIRKGMSTLHCIDGKWKQSLPICKRP